MFDLVVFLIAPSKSEVYTTEFNSRLSMTSLPSFGFKNDSCFKIKVILDSPARISIFLYPKDKVLPYSDLADRLRLFCNGSVTHISEYNMTSHESEGYMLWEGQIERKGIYVPLIVNCGLERRMYSVTCMYDNTDTLLDYRNEHNSDLKYIVALVNGFLLCLWVYSLTDHPEFDIPLMYGFACLPMIKCVASAFSMCVWTKKSYTDEKDVYLEVLSLLLNVFYCSFFLSSVVYALSGWCVFRDTLELTEICEIFFSSTILSCGFVMGTNAKNMGVALLAVALSSYGLLWFIKQCGSYIYVLLKLKENVHTDFIFISKISLVSHFLHGAMLVSSFVVVLNSMLISMDMWPFFSVISFEIATFLIQVLQYIYFRPRNSVRGSSSSMSVNLKTSNGSSLVELDDPLSMNVSILSF